MVAFHIQPQTLTPPWEAFLSHLSPQPHLTQTISHHPHAKGATWAGLIMCNIQNLMSMRFSQPTIQLPIPLSWIGTFHLIQIRSTRISHLIPQDFSTKPLGHENKTAPWLITNPLAYSFNHAPKQKKGRLSLPRFHFLRCQRSMVISNIISRFIFGSFINFDPNSLHQHQTKQFHVLFKITKLHNNNSY